MQENVAVKSGQVCSIAGGFTLKGKLVVWIWNIIFDTSLWTFSDTCRTWTWSTLVGINGAKQLIWHLCIWHANEYRVLFGDFQWKELIFFELILLTANTWLSALSQNGYCTVARIIMYTWWNTSTSKASTLWLTHVMTLQRAWSFQNDLINLGWKKKRMSTFYSGMHTVTLTPVRYIWPVVFLCVIFFCHACKIFFSVFCFYFILWTIIRYSLPPVWTTYST